MALVSDGFFLSVNLTDSSGVNTTSKTYELTAANIADAVTDAGVILTRLALVSGCVVTSYTVGQRYIEDAVTLPANVELENRARVSGYILGQGTKRVNIDIPGALSTLFQATSGEGRNQVDITNANLLSYLSTFQNSGEAYVSDGEQLGTVIGGKRIHVKNLNG